MRLSLIIGIIILVIICYYVRNPIIIAAASVLAMVTSMFQPGSSKRGGVVGDATVWAAVKTKVIALNTNANAMPEPAADIDEVLKVTNNLAKRAANIASKQPTIILYGLKGTLKVLNEELIAIQKIPVPDPTDAKSELETSAKTLCDKFYLAESTYRHLYNIYTQVVVDASIITDVRTILDEYQTFDEDTTITDAEILAYGDNTPKVRIHKDTVHMRSKNETDAEIAGRNVINDHKTKTFRELLDEDIVAKNASTLPHAADDHAITIDTGNATKATLDTMIKIPIGGSLEAIKVLINVELEALKLACEDYKEKKNVSDAIIAEIAKIARLDSDKQSEILRKNAEIVTALTTAKDAFDAAYQQKFIEIYNTYYSANPINDAIIDPIRAAVRAASDASNESEIYTDVYKVTYNNSVRLINLGIVPDSYDNKADDLKKLQKKFTSITRDYQLDAIKQLLNYNDKYQDNETKDILIHIMKGDPSKTRVILEYNYNYKDLVRHNLEVLEHVVLSAPDLLEKLIDDNLGDEVFTDGTNNNLRIDIAFSNTYYTTKPGVWFTFLYQLIRIRYDSLANDWISVNRDLYANDIIKCFIDGILSIEITKYLLERDYPVNQMYANQNTINVTIDATNAAINHFDKALTAVILVFNQKVTAAGVDILGIDEQTALRFLDSVQTQIFNTKLDNDIARTTPNQTTLETVTNQAKEAARILTVDVVENPIIKIYINYFGNLEKAADELIEAAKAAEEIIKPQDSVYAIYTDVPLVPYLRTDNYAFYLDKVYFDVTIPLIPSTDVERINNIKDVDNKRDTYDNLRKDLVQLIKNVVIKYNNLRENTSGLEIDPFMPVIDFIGRDINAWDTEIEKYIANRDNLHKSIKLNDDGTYKFDNGMIGVNKNADIDNSINNLGSMAPFLSNNNYLKLSAQEMVYDKVMIELRLAYYETSSYLDRCLLQNMRLYTAKSDLTKYKKANKNRKDNYAKYIVPNMNDLKKCIARWLHYGTTKAVVKAPAPVVPVPTYIFLYMDNAPWDYYDYIVAGVPTFDIKDVINKLNSISRTMPKNTNEEKISTSQKLHNIRKEMLNKAYNSIITIFKGEVNSGSIKLQNELDKELEGISGMDNLTPEYNKNYKSIIDNFLKKQSNGCVKQLSYPL